MPLLRKYLALAFLLFAGIFLWTCNVSDGKKPIKLNVKLQDSLSTEAGHYDTIRVDILSTNGDTLLAKVYDAPFHSGQGQISGIDLGSNPPTNFTVLVTGYKGGQKKLAFTISVTGNTSTDPAVIFVANDTTVTPPSKPTSVSIQTPSPLTLTASSSPTPITATVLPQGASQEVLWSSQDTGVAKISASGMVSPGKTGTTVITARVKQDTTLSATLTVTVIASLNITGITVSPKTMLLYTGGATGTLSALTTPDSSGSFVFLSLDTAIAKVSAAGVVTGLAVGQATILVSPLGLPSLADQCAVEVRKDVPVLDAGADRQVKPNVEVAFPITVTQNYGTISVLKWDLNGDGVWEDSTTNATASPKFTYPLVKEYQAVFYVRDSEGNAVTVTRRVVVGSQPFVDITVPSGRDTLVNNPTFHLVYTVDSVKTTKDTVLKEGPNPIVIMSTNSQGTGKDSVLITLDTTPPNAPVFDSALTTASPTNNKRPKWAWKSGGGGIGTYRYQLQSGTATTSTATSFSPASDLVDSTYTLLVAEKDSAGNWSANASRSIVVKTSGPGAPIFDSAATTVSPTNNKRPKWVWKSGGGGTGTYRYQLNGGALTTTTLLTFTPTADLPDTIYTLTVAEQDVAGNWSTNTSKSIVVKTAAPSTPSFVDSLTTASPTRSTGPTWAWKSGLGGAGKFRYKLDNGSLVDTSGTKYTASGLADGNHTVKVIEQDAAGNWSDTASRSILIKALAPLAPSATTVSSPTRTPQWNWTSGGGGNGTFRTKLDAASYPSTGSTALSYAPTGLADGSHTLCVEEADVIGWGAEACAVIKVDTAGPVITLTNPASNPANSTSLTMTLSGKVVDTGSGVVSLAVSGAVSGNGTVTISAGTWTSPALTLKSGANSLVLTATDAVGNQRTLTVTVNVNVPASVVVITSPADNLTITRNSSIDVMYSVDGGATQTKTFSLTEGVNSLVVASSPNASGNVGSDTVIVTKDATNPNAPTVFINSALTNTTGTWTWTSNGDNSGGAGMRTPAQFRYSLDNGTNWTLTTTAQYQATVEGSYTLIVQEQDKAGNWSAPSASKTIVVDKTSPVLTFTSTTDPKALITSQNPTISGTVNDNSLNSVWYTISGDANNYPLSHPNNTWSINPTLSDGDWTITVYANDLALNPQKSISVTIHKRANVVFVRQGATGSGTGNSWADAYTTLTQALAANSTYGIQLWVGAGTYTPSTSSGWTDNNLSIYGGFPSDGTGTSINGRNVSLDSTILTATADSMGLTLSSGSIGNVMNLNGLHFKNGTNALNIGNQTANIVNCTFSNFIDQSGGGGSEPISISGAGSVLFDSCTFAHNTGLTYGMLYIQGGSVTISHSYFQDNQTVGNWGAGFTINGSGGAVNLSTTTFTYDNYVLDAGSLTGSPLTVAWGTLTYQTSTTILGLGMTMPTGSGISSY